MSHGTNKVAGYLDVDAELEKEIGVDENSNHQNAQGSKEVKGIPENVSMRVLKSPLDKGSNTIVDRKPKTQKEVSPFVYARYFFEWFQSLKIEDNSNAVQNKTDQECKTALKVQIEGLFNQTHNRLTLIHHAQCFAKLRHKKSRI